MVDTIIPADLRAKRIEIYCKELGNAICDPNAILQALGIGDAKAIPPEAQRNINFKQFVKENFLRDYDNFSDNYLYTWPQYGVEQKKAYKALADYARTPYGAAIIRRVLLDNKNPGKPLFLVKLYDADSARGYTNFIRLPSGFPLKTVLSTGDIVDPVAIIHHEFGHTRYFSGHTHGKEVTIQDERGAVINMENPARMFNKNEPRYAYYSPTFKRTINIITGEEKPGVWMFDKLDPRKLVTPK